MENILTSVKKLLGMAEGYTAFDADLIMHINSVFMILTQMGVGPKKGFSISDAEAKWSEFVPEGLSIEAVKTYVALKVRLLFDPPQSSTTMEAVKSMIAELEWRLRLACEEADNMNDI
jgi:hypothetical protein